MVTEHSSGHQNTEEDGPETKELRRLSPTVDLIMGNWAELSACVTDARRPQFALRLHRLKENAVRLYFRMRDALLTEEQFGAENLRNEYGERHHYLQIQLVDRIESFHQQVYASVSSLVMIPAFVGPRVMKREYPIDSVQKFLQSLKEHEFRYNSNVSMQIDVLIRSAEFRAKFVDHPQQHILHDWMTETQFGKHYVIYFRPHESGTTAVLYRPDTHDPESPEYRPPVDVGDHFYVAPLLARTYTAFQAVATATLRRVLEEHQKRGSDASGGA